MIHSSPDMLALVADLNANRIAKVAGKRTKRLGGMRMLSDKAAAVLKTARLLHHRYVGGNYQHTEQERGRLVECAQLMLVWHAENEGVQPKAWKPPTNLESKVPCPPGTYERILEAASQGWPNGFQISMPKRTGAA